MYNNVDTPPIRPTCFAQYPSNPQDKATNSCYDCPVRIPCVKFTREIEDKRTTPFAPEGSIRHAEIKPALNHQEGGDHYKTLPIQPVEFIHANSIGFFEGNIIKYVVRWRKKNGVDDLKKARHYIDLLIELEEKK